MKESKTAANPAPLYKEAEQILADEMPFAPIYQYTKVEMIKPDMRGMGLTNLMQNWYLKDMYRAIVAVGNDIVRRGARQCGSILIERMTVAGD